MHVFYTLKQVDGMLKNYKGQFIVLYALYRLSSN